MVLLFHDGYPNESDGEDSAVSLSDRPLMRSLDGAVIPPSDPFEFLPSAASSPPEMCSADDVISRGKLLPFGAPPPPPPSKTLAIGYDHRRCCSMDDRPRRGKVTPSEYRRLRQASDPGTMRARPPPPPPPKWYMLAFGPVRVPAGIEMSEIRIRQRRRVEMMAATAEQEEECATWKVLRSLSCKGVDVAKNCHSRRGMVYD